jgi:glucans biosynthesis protein C
MDTKNARKYYLDWLRVLAILSVFIYHSTKFFDLGNWHIKNANIYFEIRYLETFMEIWMMPFIFAISGASVYFAMEKGGAGKFFKDKVLRLGVPLLVGVFTHASLQVYLERLTHHQFSGSYFEFLPHYFDGFYIDAGVGGNFAWAGMHLWYLLVLFLFCILCYPIFHWLKGRGQKILSKTGNFLALPAMVYLLAVPLTLVEGLTSDTPLDELQPGGWNFMFYLCFFILGFVLISSERLLARMQKMRWASLGVSLVLSAGFLFLIINANNPSLSALSEELDDHFLNLAAWAWIFTFLGFGMQRLNFTNPTLKYANEAVLPFYILHQTVLLCVGYFIVQWAIPDVLKWALIVLISFTVIMSIYEFLIRRFNLMRILFGMKPLPRQMLAQPTEAVLAR